MGEKPGLADFKAFTISHGYFYDLGNNVKYEGILDEKFSELKVWIIRMVLNERFRNRVENGFFQ